MFLAAALAIVTNSLVCSAFGTTRTTKSRIIGTLPSFSSPRKTFSLSVAGGGNVEIPGGAGQPPRMSKEEEDKVQWDLFMKHHARGKWRGTWTTYDYMGDVVDETLARCVCVAEWQNGSGGMCLFSKKRFLSFFFLNSNCNNFRFVLIVIMHLMTKPKYP